MRTLLSRSVIHRGMLALVLAGSIAGAAGVTSAGTAGAAPKPITPPKATTPTCAQVHAAMDSYPVDSWQFRYLSMKACTGSW